MNIKQINKNFIILIVSLGRGFVGYKQSFDFEVKNWS